MFLPRVNWGALFVHLSCLRDKRQAKVQEAEPSRTHSASAAARTVEEVFEGEGGEFSTTGARLSPIVVVGFCSLATEIAIKREDEELQPCEPTSKGRHFDKALSKMTMSRHGSDAVR